MKKEVRVWKVITDTRKSTLNRKCASKIKRLILSYPVGKFIKPKIGKIFCFKSKKYAELYKKRRMSVCKAVAINPVPIKRCLGSIANECDIINFWNGCDNYIVNAFPGTYVCDELKCLE